MTIVGEDWANPRGEGILNIPLEDKVPCFVSLTVWELVPRINQLCLVEKMNSSDDPTTRTIGFIYLYLATRENLSHIYWNCCLVRTSLIEDVVDGLSIGCCATRHSIQFTGEKHNLPTKLQTTFESEFCLSWIDWCVELDFVWTILYYGARKIELCPAILLDQPVWWGHRLVAVRQDIQHSYRRETKITYESVNSSRKTFKS